MKKLLILPALALIAACTGSGDHVADPGERVVYKDRFVEVPRPCPVKKPVRPAKVARPLPADPASLAALLIAKLMEWDGPGKYGDQADAAITTCTKPQ